jgi:16S rRNA processing protein RimM
MTSPALNSAESSSSEPRWITLAQLLRPQGRKGELLAELLTDFPERFTANPRVFLAPPNFSGSSAEARAIDVMGFWLPVGKNAGRIVLSFAGIDSISAAESLERLEVIVPASERLALDDDAEYIHDLAGCTLFDGPNLIGTVEDVQFPTTSDGTRRLDDAAPLLAVVTADGAEVLIPWVKPFIVSVDTSARRIDMNLPEGLVDLNR